MLSELPYPARRWLYGASFPLAVAGAWQALVMSGLISEYGFSDPARIVKTGGEMLLEGELIRHAGISLLRLLGGMMIGAGAGIAIAFAVYLSRPLKEAVSPTLNFLSNFPPVVWAPPIIAAFGVGEVSKIVFIAVTAGLVMFAATFQGLRSIDGKLLEALAAYPKPLWVRIRRLYAPGAAPLMLEGLKTAVMFGWIALLFAEMMGSENGLGWLLWDARTFGRPAEMMVALLCIGLIGKISVDMIDWVAKRTSPWYGQYKEPTANRGRNGDSTRGRRDRLLSAWVERTPAG